MIGRVCLVTGATRGIGRATAEALAKLGATVVVHGRDRARVGETCRDITRSAGHSNVSGIVADLSALADVRRLSGEVLAEHERLDILINNAGGATRRRRTSADGFEWQFAVNHLAPFLLTNLLLTRLKASAPSRIITVSSMAHRRGTLELDDLNWEHRKYSGLKAYSDSKLANIVFTQELARRLEGIDVTANSLHPGVVATNIFGGMGVIGSLVGFLLKPIMLSPAAGAATSVYLASSSEVAPVSGKFFDKCKAVEPAAAANDTAAARRLWQLSWQMSGLAQR
jgi:NAD(P)-dependent dehydrogenase (short-subunit alcohol dehydrogenase family)